MLGRQAGVEHDAALRLGRRDSEIGLAEAAVEGQRLAFEAVAFLAGQAAARRPGEPGLGREVEDEGQLRLQPGNRDVLQRGELPGAISPSTPW